MIAATFACALAFAAIHLFIGRMSVLHAARRSGWLSFCGGVAVAYVFLHVLPELAVHNAVLVRWIGEDAWLADQIVYLVALAGLLVFYGLERHVQASREANRAETGEDRPEQAVFHIHMAAFAVYNLIIGYLLLHREEPGFLSLALYAAALGVHFLSNDFGLYLHHRQEYARRVRWIMAGAVLAGWLLGLGIEVPEAALALIFAFLAGSVVMNVMKEELPEDRGARFAPFFGGTFFYGAVLLIA
jgi:zinc transporter ZupT